MNNINRPKCQYRVTKYDPVLRSSSGAYPVGDWTSHSDVGKKFGQVLLTEDLYLCTEQAYLDAASAFLAEAKLLELKVVGLENHRAHRQVPLEGVTLKPLDIPPVLRSLLRENFWCKLEGPSSFIHVGYDYYMYIGTPIACPNASLFAKSLGLFVENLPSPYA